MTVELFLILLTASSTINGLLVEIIKTFIPDGKKVSYNLIAIICGLIVGTGETFLYYVLKTIDINLINAIYAVLMGLATAMSSQVGYDKIKQLIDQLVG